MNRWTGAEIQAVLKGAATLDGEWKAVEGATAAETERGDWFSNTGCPLDADNRKVTTSCFLKER